MADGQSFWNLLAKFEDESRSFFLDAMTALAVNGISGDYVEFGSAGAVSMTSAFEAIRATGAQRHMWAFDSFEGLPEAVDDRDRHPQWGSGGGGGGSLEAFRKVCDQAEIPRSAYTTVVGYFADTLRPLCDDGEPSDIALAYIDCNMYSSTVSVLDFLAPRMKHGMIIGLDDYQCWSPTDVSGERTALHKFQCSHPEWRLRRYKDIHWAGVSFVVEHGHLLDQS